MPNWRASYEAEAMIPRFSPPTAIGLPRNRASAACSTDAKKASASRCTMDRDRGKRGEGRAESGEVGRVTPCAPSLLSALFSLLSSIFHLRGLLALPDQGHHHP